MGQYIKVNNEWKHIIAVYKKINGSWEKQDQYAFDNNIYIFDSTAIDFDVFLIIAEQSYSGKHFYLVANLNGRRVYPTWSITSGSEYATINANGKVTIREGADNNNITVQVNYRKLVQTATISVSYDNQLTIEGPETMVGTSGNVIALYNNGVVEPTWSITSGSTYATIDNTGSITILDSGNITVSASYNNYTATKTISVEYNASQSSHTNVDPNTGAITNTETSTVTDPETGITTETSTSSTTNADGSTSTSSTEVTTNPDGSSSTSSSTTHSNGTTEQANYTTSSPDSDGAVTTIEVYSVNYPDGTSYETESTVVENEDGSSSGQYSTTTYDENGEVTSSQDTEISISAPDENGSVTTETSMSTLNIDGTSEQSNATEVRNSDGSSTANSETLRYDANGDFSGSTTSTTNVNADSSSQSQTTNYNAEGDPTDQQNVGVDTTGNVNTQDVEFDSNGDPTVVGYDIDTTLSEGAGKEIEGNGINTEFVPFKFASEGFVINIIFKSIASEQPNPPITPDTEDTGTNYLYTILGAKTTAKVGNIWPGFEIRWTIPKKTGSSELQISRTLSGETTSTRTNFVSGHDGNNVYNLTITYDPSKTTNKFIVHNNITNTNIQTSNKTIQSDLDLDLTIGYSTDHLGDPIRHSNVTIYEFNVSKLQSS